MKVRLLSIKQVVKAYKNVAALYPNVPPLSMWRAWELAAYKKYKLFEPVLDIGCGDGQYFKLVWPKIKEVTGIDHDVNVVSRAVKSGFYRSVCLSSAQELPFEEMSFKSAFANCSLDTWTIYPEFLSLSQKSSSQVVSFL